MEIYTDIRERMVVLTPAGDKLISANASALKARLTQVQSEGHRNIIMNLENISFVDSSGLSALLVGNRVCRESKGSFVMTGIHEHVLKLIHIAQLHSVLIIVPTLSEASDLILMDEIEKDLSDS